MSYKTLHDKIQLLQVIENLTENSLSVLGCDGFIDHMIQEGLAIEKWQDPLVVLHEELTQKEIEKADRMKDYGHSSYLHDFLRHSPKAAEEFDKQRNMHGEAGRIRMPMTLSNDSEPHREVMKFLSNNGYKATPESYQKGIAHKEVDVGNPSKGIPMTKKTVSYKIGGILEKHRADDDLKRAFTNDPSRASSKTKQFDVLFSHAPQDIYAKATGWGTKSCANMRGEGSSDIAARKMPESINNQEHVAYLLKKGGSVDDKIARRTYTRYDSISNGVNHKTLFPEPRVYGDAPSEFATKMDAAVDKLFPKKPNIIYKRNKETYQDGSQTFKFSGTPSKDDIDTAWKTLDNHEDHGKTQLAELVVPHQKYKSKALTTLAGHLGDADDAIKAGDFLKGYRAMNSYESDFPAKHGHHTEAYESSRNAIAQHFDASNGKHIAAIGNDHLMRYKVLKNLPDVKTPEDAIRNIKAQEAINGRLSYDHRLKIADDHQIPGDMFHTLAKTAANHRMLTDEVASHIFHSIPEHIRRNGDGNYYDRVHALTKDPEIPGSHELMKEVARKLNRMSARSAATTFYYSKPETAAKLAELSGINHKRLIDEYGDEFRRQDEILNKAKT